MRLKSDTVEDQDFAQSSIGKHDFFLSSLTNQVGIAQNLKLK
jgi:hypothetical protein